MILTGSRALMFRAPFILNREPKDFDFIASKEEAENWCREKKLQITEQTEEKIISESEIPCEFELIQEGKSSEMLLDLVQKDIKTIKTSFGMVPNLNLLFTLKASHKYLKNSPHFWKTAMDYHRMKSIGCKILPEYQEFFKLREKETYVYRHPKLNVNKDKFFDGDQVKYVYDHDTIHEAVKQLDRPAYTYYQKDGAEVQCDKNKFFALDEKVRLSGVIEEAAVLAIERSLVPFPGVMTPKQAWMFALSKVCTSITSGWFREYAYEHVFEVVKLYPENYWEKFQQAVNDGVVKVL